MVCWEGDHMVFSVFGMVAAVVYVLGMPVAGYLGFDGQIEGAWRPARSLVSCTMVTTKSAGGGK